MTGGEKQDKIGDIVHLISNEIDVFRLGFSFGLLSFNTSTLFRKFI